MKLAERIASIIGSRPLASAIRRSVQAARSCGFVSLAGSQSTWSVFEKSLGAAIRDIEAHPRGKLFQRLIEYGPHNPDVPKALTSDGRTTLSDPESEQCVEFVYSHMINRFKGELAELLALEPCVKLITLLRRQHRLPPDVRLYWGDNVQERRRIKPTRAGEAARWGGFTKGADGLLVRQLSKTSNGVARAVVEGIVEVKSMVRSVRSSRSVLNQIGNHLARLAGGVNLGGTELAAGQITVRSSKGCPARDVPTVRIMVVPSAWKLSREWKSVKTDRGRKFVFPEFTGPPMENRIEKVNANTWRISLAWSQEALSEAAYEMTFWYMSQVGLHVYSKKALPQGWKQIPRAEVGYHAIKMMLYYIPLRYISARHGRLATRLYNVYCYGYPLGADSKETLWPEDFPEDGPHAAVPQTGHRSRRV